MLTQRVKETLECGKMTTENTLGGKKKLNDNKKNGENDLKTEEGDLKEEKESDTLREMKT